MVNKYSGSGIKREKGMHDGDGEGRGREGDVKTTAQKAKLR